MQSKPACGRRAASRRRAKFSEPALWIPVAGMSGALSVALGAYGAHGLGEAATPEQLASWSTAVQYQLLHSVALLALALFAAATERAVHVPAGLLTAGILHFCGSIYFRILFNVPSLGPVTPFGGLCLIAGWISLAASARRLRKA